MNLVSLFRSGSRRSTSAASRRNRNLLPCLASALELLENRRLLTALVTADGVNEAPVTYDDGYTTNEDTPLTVPAPGVLGNDSDADGNALAPVLKTGASHGTVAFGGLRYVTDTTPADFAAGSGGSTQVVGDGEAAELILGGPQIDNPFTGSALPAGWQDKAWDPDGLATVAGGRLTVDGAHVLTTASYGAGRSLEFLATFNGSAPYQHVGFAGGLDVTQPWAMFSTYDGSGGIFARSKLDNVDPAKSIEINTPLTGINPAVPHLFRIDWTPTGVDYFVDGTPVASHTVAIGLEMSPVVSDFTARDGGIAVDSMRMTPISGTFDSRLFDGGGPGAWTSASWEYATAGVPVTLSVRTGDTPAPDATWTPFTPVSFPGENFEAAGRYVQYRATLTAINPGQTPALRSASLRFQPSELGGFIYTPDADFNGTDAFTYEVSDGLGGLSTASVSLTVNAVNDAPVAHDGTLTTDEDTPKIGTASATDVEGDVLTFAVVDGPAHGTLTSFDPNTGAYAYRPDANYNGTDHFSFRANDGGIDFNVGTVAVTVNAVSDAPVANGQSLATNEDTDLPVTLTGSDVDGDAMTWVVVQGPAHGTLLGSGATLIYRPAANYNGPDGFTFKANDGAADSDVATVDITVNAVNDAPVAHDDGAHTDEDAAVVVAVAANDTDADGDALTVSAVTQGGHGSVTFSGGSVTYTPDGNFNGADSFGYTISDGQGGTARAAVSVTVHSVNDAPVAKDDGFTTSEDRPVSGNVLDNDTDADGDSLSAALVNGPAHGTVSLGAGGAGTSHTDTTAADFGAGATHSTGVVAGSRDGEVTLAPEFLEEFSGPALPAGWSTALWGDGGAAPVTGGQLSLDGARAFTNVAYGPGRSLEFVATFGGAASQHVGFAADSDFHQPWAIFSTGPEGTQLYARSNANAENDTPLGAQYLGSAHRYRINWNATSVDYFIDGNLVVSHAETITSMHAIASDFGVGGASLSVDWLRMSPYTGTFQSRVFDGGGAGRWDHASWTSDTPAGTSLILSVRSGDTPTPDGSWSAFAPLAGPGAIAGQGGRYVQYQAVLSTNDADVTPALRDATLHFAPTGTGVGGFTYTPDADFNGTDAFTYEVSDGHGGTATATVSITVNGVNDAPTVSADVASVTVNEGTTARATGTFGDIDSASVTLSASKGTVTSDGDGTWSWSYGAADDEAANDVTITATDAEGLQATAKFSLSVANVAPTPSIASVAEVRVEGTEIAVTGSATDPAGANDTLTYTWAVYKDGSATPFATGANNTTFRFTPDDNGSYRIALTVSDEGGGSARVEQTIAVQNVAPTPTIVSIGTVRLEGTAIAVTGSFADPGVLDHPTLAWAVYKVGDASAFAVGSGANFAFTPDDNGSYRIELTAADKDLGSTTVSQTIAVANVAPTASIENNGPVNEASAVTVSLTGGTDASTIDAPALRYFFSTDKSARDAAAYATSGTTASRGFTFNDNGVYTVYARVLDKDGGYTDYETEVKVNNVPPTASIAGATSGVEGTAVALTGSATDPSSADTAAGLTYAWSVTKDGSPYATGTGAAISFTPNDNGVYVVSLNATDKDGGVSPTATHTINVANAKPETLAIAIPPGAKVEGSAIMLTGSATDPAGVNDTLTYAWSVRKNGAAYATGAGPGFTFTPGDNGTYSVTLTVSDEDGGVSYTSADIVVGNVAPTLTSLTGDATGVRGQSRSFNATFTDPGADTWTATVNYGDGKTETFTNVAKAFGFSHVYTASGAYTVTLTVSDNDGGASSATKGPVVISAAEIQGADLVVGGTTAADSILLTGTGVGISVSINGLSQGLFRPTGRVIVYGQDGNDTIQANSTLTNSVEFNGDGGNDMLVGGGGPSLLRGGPGDDTLVAGLGRTLMIGGDGADKLSGGGADDLLIGGRTTLDNNDAALRRIMAEWASARTSAQRVANIRAGVFSDGTSNAALGLNAGTVLDDGAVDALTGSTGSDWMFAGAGDLKKDVAEILN